MDFVLPLYVSRLPEPQLGFNTIQEQRNAPSALLPETQNRQNVARPRGSTRLLLGEVGAHLGDLLVKDLLCLRGHMGPQSF